MEVTQPADVSDEREPLLRRPKMIGSATDFFLIFAILGLTLASFCVYSTIGPIYTLTATEKGTTTTISGLVFAVYPFVILILSPFVGKYLPKIGPIYALVVGSLLEGLGEILFGFVVLFHEQWTFVLFSFLLRIITAIGATFSKVAVISIITVLYPDHVSVSFGLLGVATGVGLMIGPSLGGSLYQLGGFKLPFIVIGVFVWLMLAVTMLTLPRNRIHTANKEEKVISVIRVVKVPGVSIVGMCIVTTGICITFYESTIAVQLDNITKGKFTKAQIGAFFLFSAGFYTLSSPLCGLIVEHKIPGKYVMIIGHVIAMISFMFLGPAPFLQSVLTASPVSTAISLCLEGISVAPLLVPVIGTMQMYAVCSGLENDMSLGSVISGIFSFCFQTGSIIGPSIGGFLLQYSTFSWGCFILMVLLLIEGIVLAAFIFYKDYQELNKEHTSTNHLSRGADIQRLITEEDL